ncbi:hypothetical protein SOCE26_071130 [Sorangium cellulosum]|uniref:Uncharacterized protein n=1 Tax=Sorangium cellulosum TaxID=56 RepID=A0A2L0F209_SORCE|nr:VCBS repeat-containing protein [Sorangium cellulosum]AUX45618.1 hypothetical protein SOCE26_071130 [Sorangium cellulosum]
MTVGVLVLSCTSDHQVSPWGAARRPPLSVYVAPPDLDAHLGAIDAEAAELGLTLEVELRGALPRGGGEVVVRGYRGTDALGRRTSAVRVATPRGVVMAAGPIESGRVDRSQATELVPSLLPGPDTDAAQQLGLFRSGTDLNRDGAPDVALRNEAGALEVWALQPLGAARYTVELAVPPRFALDVDRDGSLELAGRVPVDDGDPIRPDLVDVAGFEGGRYTHRSGAARAFHEARAGGPGAGGPGAGGPGQGKRPEPPKDDAVRLRRALEQAWHALLAGRPAKETLAALDREPVPAALREVFSAHRARVAELAAASSRDAPAPVEEAPRGTRAPTRPQEASGRPD